MMKHALIITSLVLAGIPSCKPLSQETPVKPLSDTFSFQQELRLPGSPEVIYDAISGDISGWWDHSFSKPPYKLYLEAKPGGGFYEIFNERGDGALHATVICAERGETAEIRRAAGAFRKGDPDGVFL